MISILDASIFRQVISIYHSKSHSCSQMYTVNLATSYYWIYWNISYLPFYFYFVSFANLKHCADWYDSQFKDWLIATYRLVKLQLTTCKLFRLQFTDFPLTDSQMAGPYFRVNPICVVCPLGYANYCLVYVNLINVNSNQVQKPSIHFFAGKVSSREFFSGRNK